MQTLTRTTGVLVIVALIGATLAIVAVMATSAGSPSASVADGSVSFIRGDIAPAVYTPLPSYSGGEVITD